ncbi:MAG: UDP-N-acetylmuramoyl-L-alanine--D-glutamate ligase [Nitrospinae bacterium]|nr:UDP-N-acetylmuramoyl-L-alanine--D-glutamate ligase [Nitrospinota bacterium]
MRLENKKTVVIGMGRTGIATANFLAARKTPVTLIDAKPRAELEEAVRSLNPAVQTAFDCSEPPADAELIVLSPGVDIHAPFLEGARKRGTEIISEIELASRFCQTPIIAVTGTNGKSTVTTLIGDILQRAGKQVAVGGNLGAPFIGLLDAGPVDYFVLEISTFQLEGAKTFHPQTAMILNITPDHLDRHKTFEEYAALKGKIAACQTQEDVLVLNSDDANVMDQGEKRLSRKVHFSVLGEVAEGAFLRGDSLITRFNGKEQTLLSVGAMKPAMQCQVENALAAAAISIALDTPPNAVADAIREFSGLEHRIEWVRTVNGIDFVNDSKGTNVGSVHKSLASFSRPVILIAGGKDKGGDFRPLKGIFKEKVKHLILIGETKNKFRQILNGSFSYEDAESMKDAVERAFDKAQPGDVVLLSPGCASFDMFKDFIERGNRFKDIVNRL